MLGRARAGVAVRSYLDVPRLAVRSDAGADTGAALVPLEPVWVRREIQVVTPAALMSTEFESFSYYVFELNKNHRFARTATECNVLFSR